MTMVASGVGLYVPGDSRRAPSRPIGAYGGRLPHSGVPRRVFSSLHVSAGETRSLTSLHHYICILTYSDVAVTVIKADATRAARSGARCDHSSALLCPDHSHATSSNSSSTVYVSVYP